jgi:hypothetical protein
MNGLKFAALLLGEMNHYEVIAKSDLDSRRTIVQKAGLMSISIVLAIFTGACFAHELFGAGILGMTISGLILGWFVMMIDRSILSSLETDPKVLNGIKNRRIALSILLGLLSSLGVDMWLYHNDVQSSLETMAQQMTLSQEAQFDNTQTLMADVASKKLEKEKLEMAFNLEMISGVGPRAKQKKELLVKADADLKAAEALLLKTSVDRELAVRNGTSQKLKELNGSLMYKSAAVIDLALSSLKTFLVWMVLLVVIIMIDLLPALSKSTVLTGYENRILHERNIAAMKSDLARKTMEAIAERNSNLAEITSRLSSAKNLAQFNGRSKLTD